MTRVLLATCFFIALGCNSDRRDGNEIEGLRGAESSKPIPQEKPVLDWSLVDSNDWYDLFELTIDDDESLICAAFHKTDAQLGIGITLQTAILADDRGFNYFTMHEADPTKSQKELLEHKMPKSSVLESFSRIKYYADKPTDVENHVFEVKLWMQLRNDAAEEFE